MAHTVFTRQVYVFLPGFRYAFRMRITYVTQTRFPTEKAHGHQIAQVCAALAELGHGVTLVAPNVPTAVTADPHAYYAVQKTFRVEHLHQFNALHSPFVPGFLAFMVGMASYRRSLWKFLCSHTADLFYVRSAAVLPPLLRSGVPVILELHTLPTWGRRRFVRLCNACRLVVCLTTPMHEELLQWGVMREKLLVEGDGVSLERFSHPAPVTRPVTPRPILGYAGSLVTHDSLEKGVGQIVEAAAELKKRGRPLFTWVIGGPRAWQDIYRAQASAKGLTEEDVRFDAPVPAAQVAGVLAAMDICAYPAPASHHPFFRRDTSPLKLLEYFAANKPVVCADIPPIHDVCDATSVTFCKAGDGVSMADAVCGLLDDTAAAQRKVAAGGKIAQERSWNKRMERILHHTKARP